MNTISYTYDDADRLVTIARPNLVTSTYGYDAAGQLLSLSHAGSGGTLSSFDYTYDGVGNRVAVTETFTSTVAIDYTYDPLYRLTAVEYSDLSYFHYAYDAVGNRLSYEVTGGETITYTYDIANHLTSVDGVTYTWDNNGNLLDDGLNTYAYDQANRLTSVMSMPSAASFTYNGLGDRVQQNNAGNTTTYLLDIASGLTQVLANGSGNTYLYGLGRIGEEGAGGWQYHHGDALGSVRQLTDLNGAVTLAKSYEPYGDLLSSAGDIDTPYDFAGEWRDNTGLIYLRARYYQSAVGRFISRDSWGGDYYRPNTLNWWNYGYSNPILFTDPNGKDPIGDCLGLFGLAFAEPTPIGEPGAVIGCLIIFGLAYTAWLTAQHSEEFINSCEVAWDALVEPLVRPKPGVTSPSDTIVRGVDPFSLPKMWPTPEPRPVPRSTPEPIMPRIPEKTREPKFILYHYSSDVGIGGILATQTISPSLADDLRAAFGHGQYFTDISPIDASIGSAHQLARAIYNMPWRNDRVTSYVAVNVFGLMIENVSPVFSKTYGDKYIYLHRSESPLPIGGRIITSGKVLYSR